MKIRGLEISPLAVGSWRTFDRIPRATGTAVLERARELGINFLEVARYDDDTGRAPIPTGYSEVCFGEAFRASGWPREEVLIATKLWWEFWPGQSAREELEASLGRTGLDRFDLLYSDPPPAELPLAEVVATIGELIADGTTQAWGIVNWPAARIAAATELCRAQGVAPPCLAQLAYSLDRRSPVEDEEMRAALRAGGTKVVASFVLAGGILSGRYLSATGDGRMAAAIETPKFTRAAAIAASLRELADEWEMTPAALAIAFVLHDPEVCTALLGASRPEQLEENVTALTAMSRLDADQWRRLGELGAEA
ncbi:MAG: aldo/keto reductase [Solirubrobacterales bacterium]